MHRELWLTESAQVGWVCEWPCPTHVELRLAGAQDLWLAEEGAGMWAGAAATVGLPGKAETGAGPVLSKTTLFSSMPKTTPPPRMAPWHCHASQPLVLLVGDWEAL